MPKICLKRHWNGCCTVSWINSVFFVVFLSSCTYRIAGDNRPVILGHGGMGIKSVLPLDSYESLLKAAVKFDGTEGDVQLTQNGVLVFWHDKFFKDTLLSNFNFTKPVYYRYFFAKYRLATVEALLEKIPENKVVSLDVKLYGCDRACKLLMVKKIGDFASRFSRKYDILVETHDRFLIEKLNDIRGIKVFYYAGSVDDAMSMCKGGMVDGISMKNSLVSAEAVSKLKHSGCQVMLWNIKNRRQLKSALDKKPDFLQTDFIRVKF